MPLTCVSACWACVFFWFGSVLRAPVPTPQTLSLFPPFKPNSYQPQEVEIETPLKCFIPDYLPAVGEMDAFLKVGALAG